MYVKLNDTSTSIAAGMKKTLAKPNYLKVTLGTDLKLNKPRLGFSNLLQVFIRRAITRFHSFGIPSSTWANPSPIPHSVGLKRMLSHVALFMPQWI